LSHCRKNIQIGYPYNRSQLGISLASLECGAKMKNQFSIRHIGALGFALTILGFYGPLQAETNAKNQT
jgi:hypothetical protein